MTSKPIQTITPPNFLKAKVGGKVPALDEAAVARAEAALQNLASNFDEWMKEEIDKVQAAFDAVKSAELTGDERATLYRCVHDAKGLGTTYEFPIVSAIAGTLCKLMEEAPDDQAIPLKLVEAHVQAMRASLTAGIRSDDHPVGRALLDELTSQVAEIIVKDETDGDKAA